MPLQRLLGLWLPQRLQPEDLCSTSQELLKSALLSAQVSCGYSLRPSFRGVPTALRESLTRGMLVACLLAAQSQWHSSVCRFICLPLRLIRAFLRSFLRRIFSVRLLMTERHRSSSRGSPRTESSGWNSSLSVQLSSLDRRLTEVFRRMKSSAFKIVCFFNIRVCFLY